MVYYKYIFYLLDAVGDSAVQQKSNEFYTSGRYIQALVTVDFHNVHILRQDLENKLHLAVVMFVWIIWIAFQALMIAEIKLFQKLKFLE